MLCTPNYFRNAFIIFSNHQNIGIDTSFIMFGRLFTEISEKIDCSVMAATNLHIYEYYLALIALEMSEMYVMTFQTLV